MPHPLAGKPAPLELLTDIPALISAYYTETPDPSDPGQRVSFGTSGHRGSAFKRSFNDAHVAAITQAVCDYRREQGIDGPLFLGKDTHALSTPPSAPPSRSAPPTAWTWPSPRRTATPRPR